MAFARRLQSGNPASQGDFVRIYKVLSTLASSCHADPIQTSTLSAALSKEQEDESLRPRSRAAMVYSMVY